MLKDEQRTMLGEFVRAHRERLSPELPSGRRRTPGLRREELAQRAGISATWVTWIEQGREVQASPHALARLAEALHLTRAERAYLFELANRRDPDLAIPDARENAPQSIRLIVEALDFPAYGLDRFWNVCTFNKQAADLFGVWLNAQPKPNLLRFIFLDPTARTLIDEWEFRAARVLAEFRLDFGQSFNDPPMRQLLDELTTGSVFFAKIWREQSVLDREGGERCFHHPVRGKVSYRQHTFRPTERQDYKFVLLEPIEAY